MSAFHTPAGHKVLNSKNKNNNALKKATIVYRCWPLLSLCLASHFSNVFCIDEDRTTRTCFWLSFPLPRPPLFCVAQFPLRCREQEGDESESEGERSERARERAECESKNEGERSERARESNDSKRERSARSKTEAAFIFIKKIN